MPDYDPHVDTYQRHQRQDADANPYRVIETHTFFEVLGSVHGLDILDLAAGVGRTSRMLMARGARTVLGVDIAPEMVRRAIQENEAGGASETYPGLRFAVIDARDETFLLDQPVDLVTAMYLLHYAPSEDDLERMGCLIERNLKPGGRFVTFTINPDYDLSRPEPRLADQLGFDVRAVDGRRGELVIGDMRVDIWQWNRSAHETRLGRAGLTGIRWHRLGVPPDARDLATSVAWYLANPHCIVLSAKKPG